MTSNPAGLAEHIGAHAQQIFWIGRDGRTFTYASLWENAHRVGAALGERHGIGPGDIVVPSYGNDVSHAVLLLAALQRGFVLCPLAPHMPEAARQELLDFVRPQLVIGEPLPVDPAAAPNLASPELAIDADRPYLLAVTSGSTGRPKAICHSAANIFGSSRAFAELSGFSTETRLYHVLPMTYMAGIVNSLLAVLMGGGTVVEGPLFNAMEALNFWERPLAQAANTLSLVPLIAATLIATTRDARTLAAIAGRIRHIQSTSAPIPLGLRRRFAEHFGVPLRDCYGITEVGGPVTLQSETDAVALNDFSAVGKAYEIEIRDSGGMAELWIRSPFMMKGYREGHDHYVLPCDGRGFIDTGDIAAWEDGRLAITGRKKDVIIRGGLNVSPRRIEMLLSTAAQAKEVVVLGIERPLVGERVFAFVETSGEPPALLRSLHEIAESHLAVHEVPDEFVLLRALPRLFNGKIDKKRLRQEYAGAREN